MVAVIAIVIAILGAFAGNAYINNEQNEKWYEIRMCRRTVMICLISGTGVLLALLTYYFYNRSLIYMIQLLVLYEWLIPIAYVDWKKMIIPNKLIAAGMVLYVLMLIYFIFGTDYRITDILQYSLLGLALGFGVFILCMVLSRNSVGMGDVKLYSVLGLMLGWKGVFCVLFFSVLALSVSGIYRLATGKADKSTMIPLGPFTLIGMAISMLLGV